MATTKASEAGSVLGKRSVRARKSKWGEAEYLRRQKEYSDLGVEERRKRKQQQLEAK
ncbi:MAG TPA: hypothetical protein VNF74_16210 [Terriglobales bacterium]|nr:hypothetical protein [Terriglobales bacterium]